MFVGKLKLPPEPVSPASKPTRARRVHCQKRNGCNSCRLVCWKASVIVSGAEIGKVHLDECFSSKVLRTTGRSKLNLSRGHERRGTAKKLLGLASLGLTPDAAVVTYLLLVTQGFDWIEFRCPHRRD